MTWPEVVAVLSRTLPVMAFLVAITVVAEVADLAGVFDVAGHATARLAGHRTVVLWLLISGLAVLVTVFLGLDTTAVLLTPVALTVARQAGVGSAPFAVTTLFLANTASLFLPVSNLTNLLAVQHLERLGGAHADFVRLALAPGRAFVTPSIRAVPAEIGTIRPVSPRIEGVACGTRAVVEATRRAVGTPPIRATRAEIGLFAAICARIRGVPAVPVGITPVVPVVVTPVRPTPAVVASRALGLVERTVAESEWLLSEFSGVDCQVGYSVWIAGRFVDLAQRPALAAERGDVGPAAGRVIAVASRAGAGLDVGRQQAQGPCTGGIHGREMLLLDQ